MSIITMPSLVPAERARSRNSGNAATKPRLLSSPVSSSVLEARRRSAYRSRPLSHTRRVHVIGVTSAHAYTSGTSHSSAPVAQDNMTPMPTAGAMNSAKRKGTFPIADADTSPGMRRSKIQPRVGAPGTAVAVMKSGTANSNSSKTTSAVWLRALRV
ncbi:hypothetical protein [Nakamurella antarctica]|uniref:hypothetical protein n=1 Tax=Nakamurella antarctica TaxID=1902245 RepID=UPI0013DE5C61|nr:hypothetical protein [Nakamurella antarctica]